MAQQLGLDYIWIDALYIIQDDPEDWAIEASRMDSVYEHAYCNFGASAAARSVACDKPIIELEANEDIPPT